MTTHAQRIGQGLERDAVKALPLARVGLAAALLALGAGLAVVALLGPLASGVIDYHVTETLRNQTIGLDAVSLLAVSPLSVVAALFVHVIVFVPSTVECPSASSAIACSR